MNTPPDAGRILAVPTRTMAAVPRLADALDVDGVLAFAGRLPARTTLVAGWGLSPGAVRAKALAAVAGLPFLHVEDGFFRSVGLGKNGAPPHAFSCDGQRPYYDATGGSDLEALIAQEAGGGGGADLVALIVQHRLSKYNCEPDRPPPLPPTTRRRILIVDQVVGDRSISGALATPETFRDMVAAARDECPDAQLVLRAHPDVVAGKAAGALLPLAREMSLDTLAEPVSPHALLDAVDAVWTVSSQLGFEALLRGVPVVTFGLPFYAGWGLSDDRALGRHPEVAARRGARPSAAELAAAAVGRYCRHVDPIHGGRLDAIEGLLQLARLRERYIARSGTYFCVGFRRWKRPGAAAFLSGPFSETQFMRPAQALRRPAGPARVVAWGYRVADRRVKALEERHGAIIRIEDGFLRSPGLGSDFLPSASAVVAEGPLYFDATRRNSFEALVETATFSPGLLERAARLREAVVAAGLTKYNLGSALPEDFDRQCGGRPFHLVVGQVETDASIRLGGALIRRNGDLLRAARAAAPAAFLVYKEHPDVASGNRSGRIGTADAASADLVLREGDALAAIDACDALHTMTSLAGFEALLRGKPVHCYGLPFYAGWGLTQDAVACARRRRLTLDALTAAALILYPRYVDPVSGLPCEAEDIVRLLASRARFAPVRSAGLWRQMRRGLAWIAAQARG